MHTNYNPPTVAAPASTYSHGVEVKPNARWLHISGQIGVLLGFPVIAQILPMRSATIHPVGRPGQIEYTNTDRLTGSERWQILGPVRGDAHGASEPDLVLRLAERQRTCRRELLPLAAAALHGKQQCGWAILALVLPDEATWSSARA